MAKQKDLLPGAEPNARAGEPFPAVENGGATPPEGGGAPPLPDTGEAGEGDNPAPKPQPDAPGATAAVIRHKTPYPKYRCAGLVLTQKPETYQVTEAQLEKLRRDPWVVIAGGNAT